MITDDLRELAAASGHPRAATASPFRNHDHALAQRARVLVHHAGDILAVTRTATPIFAARQARTAAAIAIILFSILLFSAFLDDASVLIPEPGLYLISTLFFAALAYAPTRWLASRRLRRRLESIDLESSPIDHARQLIDETDARCTAALIAAFATSIPVLVFSLIAERRAEQGLSGFEAAAAIMPPGDVATIAIVGILAAVLLSRSSKLRCILGSLPAVVLALALALASFRVLVHSLDDITPPTALTLTALSTIELCALTIGTWLTSRLRTRELSRLA